MYKFSTKIFSIFLILAAFCSISCSNLIENESAGIDFKISGTDIYTMMSKAGARNANTDSDEIDATVEFVLDVILVVNDKEKETQTISSSVAKAKDKTFTMSFNHIRVRSKVYLKAILRTSQGVIVTSVSNTVMVTNRPKLIELQIDNIKIYSLINSNIVLYSGTSDSKNYYQFEQIADAKIEEGETADISDALNSYTFDKDGNIYYIKTERKTSTNGIPYYEWYLYSKDVDRFNSGIKFTPYNKTQNYSYQDSSPQMCCDWTDNSLYVFEDMQPCIMKYSDISSITTTGNETNHSIIKLNSLPSDDYLNIHFFTVNEGILYLLVRVNSFDYKIIKAEPVQDETDPYLYTVNVLNTIQVKFSEIFGIEAPKTTTEELTVEENGSFSYETIDVTIREPTVTVSDMQCIFGTIYLVANQVNVNYSYSTTKGGFCRGALVQIGDDGNEIKVCGFNNSTFNLSNYYLYATDASNNYLYNSDDNNKKKILFKDSSTFNNEDHIFHAALNNIKNVFVAPQKIVAIKPKKLIILDSGVAFYTDADNALSYKKINRLVEVDLLSFVLKDSNADIGNVYTPVRLNNVVLGKKSFTKEIVDNGCGIEVCEDYSPIPYTSLINSVHFNNTTPVQDNHLYKSNGDLYTGTIRHVIFNAD